MNCLLKNVSIDRCTQFRECHPIRDGMDHFHDLRIVFDLTVPKMREHARLDDRPVEIASCDIHAAAGIDLARTRIPEPHHGDVESATAKVKYHHILWFRY